MITSMIGKEGNDIAFFTGMTFELLENQKWKQGTVLGAAAGVLIRNDLDW